MIQRVAIIGAGGHGREVGDLFDALNAVDQRYEVLGHVVDAEYGRPGTLVGGRPILGDLDWLGERAGELVSVVAVGQPELRRRIALRARGLGVRFVSAVHPTVVATARVSLGEGVVIAAGCVLTREIAIGSHVHVNVACTVSHDCMLGEFAYLAPGVHLAGRVAVGEGCYLGTGANLIEGVRVGDWAIVGAGATIIGDVPANTTVVGVPGRVVKTRAPGWHLA